MKKALVLGLGISGKSVLPFLEKRGYEVVGFDDKTSKIDLPSLSTFSLFVPSPGIPKTHSLYQAALREGIEIVSEPELALRELSNPAIGVTGTNGKSTVVKMIEHILNHAGKKSVALGNIGTPLTSYPGGEEILVIELSSYQLETLQIPCLDVALLLNITEDHLDRHSTFREYAETKIGIQNCLKKGGLFLAHETVAEEFHLQCTTFGGADSNREAAFAAVSRFGVTRSQFEEGIKTFTPLPHRLEFVTKIDGVSYFNDSKATNIAATIRAIQTFDEPLILLLGGKNKGLSFSTLKPYLDGCREVIAFGQAREEIAEHLDTHLCQTLEEAVQMAHELAQPGDTVLLAPGCTSWDAYNNYAERGDHFKTLCLQLPRVSPFGTLAENGE